MQGTSALDEVLRWGAGSFRFQGHEPPPEPNLEGETMAILLEALRRLDESSVIEKTPAEG
jgi:hypothetical protein